jgi:biopolymer transport protein ExbB/TolQ
MLGLLGSIIGFAQTFAGFDIANLQLDNQEEVKNMMASVATGIPTALNTTVMGIYASLALTAYPFLIRRNIK